MENGSIRNAICREIHKNMYVIDSLKQYHILTPFVFREFYIFPIWSAHFIIIQPKLDLIHVALNLAI